MTTLPILRSRSQTSPRARDLARGASGLGLWAAPIGLILAGSGLGSAHILSLAGEGALLVAGSAWLGLMCLANARRCGRTHCWIDGIVLPVLAIVGLVALLGLFTLSWAGFVSAIWITLVAAFVVEWTIGPYVGPPRPP